MSQRGNLGKIEFAKLVAWIHNQKLSGTLRITFEKKSKFVLFEQGKILSAFSEFPEDSFRAVIRRMQLLPESQQLELDLEHGATDGQFAKRLIEKGYVTEREFLEVLKRQNQDILFGLFEWRHGDFIFYEGKFPENKSIALKLPMKWIIEKGVERYHQRRNIDSRLPLKAVFRVPDEDFRVQQIHEHPQIEVRRVFDCLGEPKMIGDIVAATLLTEFEVVSIVLRYLERGEIQPVVEEELELSTEIKKLLAEAEILHNRGRYWEAWTRLRKAIVEVPSHPILQSKYRQYTNDFRGDLRKVISSTHLVPQIIGTIDDQVYQKFPKDSALGFLISRIDGQSTVADLGRLLQVDREKLLITIYLLVNSRVIQLVKQTGPVPKEIAERRKFIRDAWDKLEKQNYYEILGVSTESSEAEIKSAYFKLAKQYHPDARSEDDPPDIKGRLDQIFMRVREAYITLVEKEKRAEYDARVLRTKENCNQKDLKLRTKAQLQFSVGLKSLQSREYRTAMEYFRSAIDLDPYEPKYYGKLAEVCTKNPRWFRAGILSCKKAIQLDPEESTYHAVLGTLNKLDGNLLEAEKQFFKVLQLDPENLTARRELKAMGKEIPESYDTKRPKTDHTPILRKIKKSKN